MSELNESSLAKPIIGITLGDVNGIGPEVVIKTLNDPRISNLCQVVVYGSLEAINHYRKLLNLEEVTYFPLEADGIPHAKKPSVRSVWAAQLAIAPGQQTVEAGIAAYQALEAALEDWKAGKIDALVTAPITKANMPKDVFPFSGHTDYLGAKTETERPLMVLVSEQMRLGLLTVHIPLQQVSKQVNRINLDKAFRLLRSSMQQDFGIKRPRIAVLGLNPHAGEQGQIGTEEQDTIQPWVESQKREGHLISGPYPADGFFGNGMMQHFDAVLAMYHDQGLAPFKALAFDAGVNFTAGMPLVRTSPDHGTAYDIAGKGIASENAFRQSLFLAIEIWRKRKELPKALA